MGLGYICFYDLGFRNRVQELISVGLGFEVLGCLK